MTEHAPALPAGTVLERYTVERTLSEGGFGVVYLARRTGSEERCVIKEYLPVKLATRDARGEVVILPEADAELFAQGRRAFFQEAAILAALDHPNIVRVRHFFQANGTVYFVMDYEHGVTLRALIKKAKAPLREAFLRRVALPILAGLEEVHARQLLHLDIKPSNIIVRDDGRPLLIDFGAVYNLMSGPRSPQANVVSQGFSPKEQVYAGMEVGPWTDIYALGATLRACLDGRSPPPVKERLKQDPMVPAAERYRGKYSEGFLQAIDRAMIVDPAKRPRSIAALRALLGAGG